MTTPQQTAVPTPRTDAVKKSRTWEFETYIRKIEESHTQLELELLSATTSRDEALAACGKMRAAWKELSAEMYAHVPIADIENSPVMEAISRMQEAVKTTLGQSTLDELARLRAEVVQLQHGIVNAQRIQNERDTALQQSRELEERVRGLEEALQASKRLASNNYVNWANAGGPDECAHGYSKGIPCPKCDAITLEEALAKPASVPAGQPSPDPETAAAPADGSRTP